MYWEIIFAVPVGMMIFKIIESFLFQKHEQDYYLQLNMIDDKLQKIIDLLREK